MATRDKQGQKGHRTTLWERAKKLVRSAAKWAVPAGATVKVVLDVSEFIARHR
ncbi:hypothetical protein [Actinacidiphila glaucinigra]|uniref:hypothetical protein n=1 Tax=Actinacidiphila glaucinigra TaxID=235986 RepID=UPI0035E24E6A